MVWRDVSPPPLSPQESLPADGASALPLPDKPSIAVLPFTNMSGDPEQDYFSDGMTEDLITDLSKISGLFVIARHSVFTYKSQAVKIEQVGRELGVRYVLEGSTRQADNRVRVNAQLVDATTGGHLWAERYDQELKELFALQDAITQQIVGALRVEVREAEQARVRRISTDNLTAYNAWLRGLEYHWRFTKEGNAQARQLFERAIELDPQYADAYASLGWTYFLEWVWWDHDPLLLERAGELAHHALALDDSLPEAHRLLGRVYLFQKQPEQAIAEGERALALDPNDADAYSGLAEILNFAGRPEEAIGSAQQAMRLNPQYPAFYPFGLGVAYYLTGQYAEAIAALQDALRRNPNFLSASSYLAVSYVDQWAVQRNQDPQTLKRAEKVAQQLVALSDSSFWAHGNLSYVYL